MATFSMAGTPTQGVNEVQRLTPGGTISGGTFTITFEGQTTAAIAWNATAAVVQAALEALSNVNVGDVTVTGGPVNSAALDITYLQGLGGYNRTQVTVTSSLTGAAPTLTPSTVTGGVEGSFRGCNIGDWLVDTTGQDVYRNTGTRETPAWTIPATTGRILTNPPWVAQTDPHHMPAGANDYTFGPITT